jgi:hypothetical protein
VEKKMPMTQAERSSKYRKRKREEMGDEAYYAMQREYRSEWRKRAAHPQPQSFPQPESPTEWTYEIPAPQPVPLPESPAQIEPPQPGVDGPDLKQFFNEIKELVCRYTDIYSGQPKLSEGERNALQATTERNLVKVNDMVDYDTLNNNLQDDSASLKTIMHYQNQLRILYKKMHGERAFDPKDFTWLKESPDKVIRFIQDTYKSKFTQSKYINSIAGILKRLHGYENVYLIYSTANSMTAQEVENIVIENKLSLREEKNYVEWSMILDVKSKLVSSMDKLIFSLYTDLPPRRLEFRTLKLTDMKDTKEGGNYLVIDEKGIPTTIELNAYKTAHLYNQHVINLTKHKSLQTAFADYLRYYDKKVGDYIFSHKTIPNKEIGSATFIKMIMNVFKHTGKDVSVNILRHSYITYKRSTPMSIKQKRDMAMAMGNSVSVQDQYVRIK